MIQMVFAPFSSTVEMSVNRYLKWLETMEITNLLETNLFPEKLTFERRWDEHAIPMLMDIFDFLSENGILEKSGGTITFSLKGRRYLKNLNEAPSDATNPVCLYLDEGLKKLTKLLNHDENEFDINKDCFLLENAFTFPYRLELIPTLKKIYKDETKLDSPPKVALVGNFVEWFLPSMVDLIESADQVQIFVPSPQAIQRGISFVELDERTSVFSPNFHQYMDIPQEKFDIIFHFFAFGFDINPSELMKYFVERLRPNGLFIGIFPSGSKRCGIEPLFPLINNWMGRFSPEKLTSSLIKDSEEAFLTIFRSE